MEHGLLAVVLPVWAWLVLAIGLCVVVLIERTMNRNRFKDD